MMHGGKLEVKSEVGQGTTFKIFLPFTSQLEYEKHAKKAHNMN